MTKKPAPAPAPTQAEDARKPQPLPQEGGSWIRLPDGSLVREAPEPPIDQPVQED